jgi:hypothetical protein
MWLRREVLGFSTRQPLLSIAVFLPNFFMKQGSKPKAWDSQELPALRRALDLTLSQMQESIKDRQTQLEIVQVVQAAIEQPVVFYKADRMPGSWARIHIYSCDWD